MSSCISLKLYLHMGKTLPERVRWSRISRNCYLPDLKKNEYYYTKQCNKNIHKLTKIGSLGNSWKNSCFFKFVNYKFSLKKWAQLRKCVGSGTKIDKFAKIKIQMDTDTICVDRLSVLVWVRSEIENLSVLSPIFTNWRNSELKATILRPWATLETGVLTIVKLST